MYKISNYTFTGSCKGHLYLANTVSGALAKIGASSAELLQRKEFPYVGLPSAVFSTLCAEGFLVPSGKDEYQSLLERETQSLYSADPTLSFVIATTLGCNYKCPYCYQPKAVLPSMDRQTAKEVFRFIRSKLDPNVKTLKITWFGGEPLLNPDIFFPEPPVDLSCRLAGRYL